MQALAAAATMPAVDRDASANSGFGPLRPDPGKILDLPAGFNYRVISEHGQTMDDGMLVPARHDGMAAFPGRNGTVVLVCNHETHPVAQRFGAFGAAQEHLHKIDRSRVYDFGKGVTPGTGGTTTIVYDPRSRQRKRIHLSLAGTEINCAGGPTPWGSWLSCEETFADRGTSFEYGRVVHRERDHGYVFEVPAASRRPVKPVPLKAMGRFEHEAAAVDPRTGIVYLTEDRHRSLFYRFLPVKPGELARGGKLQALAVRGQSNFDTRNWSGVTLDLNEPLPVTWVDLPDPDVRQNDLRFRGHEAGAAMFARGEGLTENAGEFIFTCTIGGPERLGQVFSYRPGRDNTAEPTDTLRLIAQSTSDSLLRNADNVTMSPWGDLIVCEDTAEHCGLVGVQADGTQYPLADNAYTSAELAGVCFSPNGRTLFVNIQQRNLTLAITGPWAT